MEGNKVVRGYRQYPERWALPRDTDPGLNGKRADTQPRRPGTNGRAEDDGQEGNGGPLAT